MKAVLTLAASAFCLASLALPAQAQCYRKVGKTCRGGYATGLSAGCASKCVKPASMAAPPAAAPKAPKPHQIISPVS